MGESQEWDAIASWMIDIRRQIHRRPELGLETPETQKLVEGTLDDLGISHTRPIACGVKGVIGGDMPGAALLLRADMDGLPIQERSDLSFQSEVPGRMHACGHDCHTAMLLGAARYLKQHEAQLPRPIVLMFQPGEEGPGGAKPMIEGGVLEDPRVGEACMVHVSSDLPAGLVGLRDGFSMGACDDFIMTVLGRGGHGSTPHLGVDAIYVSAAIILAVQSIVSREQDPFDPLVVSIGTIQGGFRENVIADRVVMTGTIRSASPATREQALGRLQEIAGAIAQAHHAEVQIQVERGYPPLIADREWTQKVQVILQNELGAENVVHLEPTLGVEDFAYVAERVPALCLNVGIVGEETTTGLHSAGLLVDERGLKVGAQAFVAVALQS